MPHKLVISRTLEEQIPSPLIQLPLHLKSPLFTTRSAVVAPNSGSARTAQEPIIVRLFETRAVQIPTTRSIIVGDEENEQDGLPRVELLLVGYPTSFDGLMIGTRPSIVPLLRECKITHRAPKVQPGVSSKIRHAFDPIRV